MNEVREVFRDNVVVLTGASRGIGRELALQLADRGALLALSARDAAALDEVAALCRTRGGPVQEAKVMSAETCARLILESAARRDRELIPSARGKLGLWLKLIAPSVIDRIARKAIERGH